MDHVKPFAYDSVVAGMRRRVGDGAVLDLDMPDMPVLGAACVCETGRL